MHKKIGKKDSISFSSTSNLEKIYERVNQPNQSSPANKQILRQQRKVKAFFEEPIVKNNPAKKRYQDSND
jgi:hypothetical protein